MTTWLGRASPVRSTGSFRPGSPSSRDGSITSQGTTIGNGEVGYRLSPRVQVVAELFNILDAEVADIDYFYTSRLPGEPGEGVDDVHTHPALPRSARFGLQFVF